jgi:DNA phosphorothioation-dependent restriction protein DptH
MTQGLRELHRRDLAAELETVLFPRLASLLRQRAHGHCMSLTDLDMDLARRLVGRLRAEVSESQVVVLGNGHPPVDDDYVVSSTKLVELRNPYPDNRLRPPLLVFVPNNLHVAAEDSFGEATFETIEVDDVYIALRAQLLAELPSGLRAAVDACLVQLTQEQPWSFAGVVQQVRYLLTIKLNDFDADAAGAALFELGLVPDFELYSQPTSVPSRVRRNRKAVGTLTWSDRTERGRVLALELDPKRARAFRKRLGNYLAGVGLEDPHVWTRKLVRDRNLWDLTFDKWPFEGDGAEPEAIHVHTVTTTLPEVSEETEDPKLEPLIGQQVLVLGKGGTKSFSARFYVAPHPSKVQGLAKFVAQVISKEHGPVGLIRSKTVWKGSKLEATVNFNNVQKAWAKALGKKGQIDDELALELEGWHYVRVLAQTEEGDLVPLVDEHGQPVPWIRADNDDPKDRPHESDLFYVVGEVEEPPEPPQRAVQRDASLEHARLRLQFSAVVDGRDPAGVAPTASGWVERSSRGRPSGTEMLELKFGREGAVHVPVSRTLKVLEQKMLAVADGALAWRVAIKLGQPGAATGETARWPSGEVVARFLAARAAWFEAIRSGSKELVTQGADLLGLRPLAIAYADAYQQVIADLLRRAEAADDEEAQSLLTDLRRVLAIDTVTLVLTDHRDRRREAALVAPTHPLRALWLCAWAEVGQRWVDGAADGPPQFVVAARDAILKQLAPVGFPPVLATPSGRLMTSVDNLHPFWTLYAPSSEGDPRGLIGDVCTALGLPEPSVGGSIIDGDALASRVQRYLVQHPYVRTLVINAFNAGRAGVLAEMLLALQKQEAFEDIRYDIRLFVPDAEAPGVGAGLTELLSPSGSVTAREADAFATPTESHLRPKLGLAVKPLSEFRDSPEAHPAHLSMLFEVFPAEEVGATAKLGRHESAPVHGLVQDYEVAYEEDEASVAWRRVPRHGQALPLEDAEELTDLLSAVPQVLSEAVAAVATGQVGVGLRPEIMLALDSDERALLHQVHEVSDWVFTLDRNMGIEYFDHAKDVGRPDYLIDHSAGVGSGLGHQLVVTSRSTDELEAMLGPVLQQYKLNAEGRHAVAVLDQLRSLSGRLALKLTSAPTQRAEALGLALSRMFLEHQGVFANQVVVPLDAHLELYRVLKKQADELGENVSFKRTDLALFDLNAETRTVTCRLVEVKCYAAVGDIAAYAQLKDHIAEQIRQSEEVLSVHFDPARHPTDRPDRLVKTRELVSLLEFYLERSVRYGVVNPASADEARYLLRTLERGYSLTFTRSALIFDFEKPGTEPADLEHGIQYHRIGVDLIQQLVEAAAPTPDARAATEPDLGADAWPAERSVASLEGRRRRAPSIPTLSNAAFMPEPRRRAVDWTAEGELDAESSAAVVEPEEGAGESPAGKPDEPSVESKATPVAAGDDGVAEAPAAEPEAASEPAIVTPTPEPEPEPEPVEPVAVAPAPTSGPDHDVMLGVMGDSPQYGILGEVSGRTVAIDLNQTHTISLFGVQGGGKSYTLGSVVEMASLPIDGINQLPQPLASVIFHYSPTMDYAPEFTSMVSANSDEALVAALRERYGAEPKALSDVVMLVPEDKLEERQAEYPSIEVHPLKFAAAELQASHWRFLMGAVGNQATYIRQLNRIMKQLRDDLTLAGIEQGIDDSRMPDHIKELAHGRLEFAGDFIDDTTNLGQLLRPGRMVIVDLRDEFMEKDQALGLFVVLLQLFSEVTYQGRKFNKLVVFDEAHKYIESPDLVAGLVEVVREMRHKGTSIMVASQDPPSVPVALIELSSQIILHKFNSPAWLKHIQKANAALAGLTPERMAHLRTGEAYVWSSKASDEAFSKSAVKVRCRPRVTQHGGATKTAVKR